MKVEQLYETLKKVQEPKGYYFNKDKEKVFDLLGDRKSTRLNSSHYS